MTPTTPEITAEAILATAKRLGITLRTNVGWYDPIRKEGCAAAVAAISTNPRLAEKKLDGTDIWMALRVSGSAIKGISDGFTGTPPYTKAGKTYQSHYAIGRAVRTAVDAETTR